MIRTRYFGTIWILVVFVAGAAWLAGPAQTDAGDALRSPESFASIESADARARALFLEAAQVLTHPRCVNCHPAGDSPHQGDAAELHFPTVTRGADGHGTVGMRCETCHHSSNFAPGEVPGAPHWHLAPRSMAWEGLSAGEICEQIKDRSRNGDRSLEQIVTHMKQDSLVLWAWEPGPGREPAPGTPESFGQLIAAWADAGAACP